MASLIALSIKGKDGKYQNFTVAVNDETNKFGQNVSMYREQTKEEREAKKPKEYIGNGKVFWTDGKITKADKREQDNEVTASQEPENDLPFWPAASPYNWNARSQSIGELIRLFKQPVNSGLHIQPLRLSLIRPYRFGP